MTTSTPADDELPVGIVEDSRKGRPTPKRKEAEAANKRPLVPADRQSATKAARQAQREQRDREYKAMQTGDESAMPVRDRGPLRRYVRDYVDARFNLGEFFLPIAAVCLVVQLSFAQINAAVSIIALFGLYLYVVAAIIDGAVLWFRLKRRIVAKFGAVPRGTLMYAVMRAFQLRRSRLPKPQVKRRAYPE
ncbi:membrane protein [Cellulomonas sp. A375-1]|nr:membrane protein [Cellulomonas sp. A375-1]